MPDENARPLDSSPTQIPNPPTSPPTTPHASPSSVCWPSKVCVRRSGADTSGCSTPSAHSSAPAFASFGALRRRRAELEYPSYPGEKVEAEELQDAITTVEAIIEGAEKLVSHLGIFSTT